MTAPRSDFDHPQWLVRPPTAEERTWAVEWMRSRDKAYEAEWLCEWKVISDMLRAAGYRVLAGGGPETDDVVRDLIRRAMRADKIADMHHKRVVAGGMTDGCCNECGLAWPCPTFVWATEDSTRDPVIDCWDPDDDEAPAAGSVSGDRWTKDQIEQLDRDIADFAAKIAPAFPDVSGDRPTHPKPCYDMQCTHPSHLPPGRPTTGDDE